MSVLLDANALLALCWPHHTHHEKMVRWLKRDGKKGWATCALTQAAFVRVSMQPAFAGRSMDIGDVADVLRITTEHPKHEVLPVLNTFSEVERICTGGIIGHRQISDAWLLASAMASGCKLLTFDSGLSTLLTNDEERTAHILTFR